MSSTCNIKKQTKKNNNPLLIMHKYWYDNDNDNEISLFKHK